MDETPLLTHPESPQCDPKPWDPVKPVSPPPPSSNFIPNVPVSPAFAGICPCAFGGPLPRENCTRPGYHAEFALALSEIFGFGNRVQIVPADGMVEGPAHPNSLFNQVRDGRGDFGTVQRVFGLDISQDFAFAETQIKDEIVFIYKSDGKRPPELSIISLVYQPIGYWFLLLFLSSLNYLVTSHLTASQKSHLFALGRNQTFMKFCIHIQAITGALSSVFLAAMTSLIFTLLTRAKPTPPINSVEEILVGVREGRLQLVTQDPFIYSQILNPILDGLPPERHTPMVKGFAEAAKHHSPIIRAGEGLQTAVKRMSEETIFHRKSIYVIQETFVANFVSFGCGMEYLSGSKAGLPNPRVVILMNKALSARMNETSIELDRTSLIRPTMRRLIDKYMPPNRDCPPELRLYHEQFILGVGQLSGLMTLTLALLLLASTCFAIEWSGGGGRNSGFRMDFIMKWIASLTADVTSDDPQQQTREQRSSTKKKWRIRSNRQKFEPGTPPMTFMQPTRKTSVQPTPKTSVDEEGYIIVLVDNSRRQQQPPATIKDRSRRDWKHHFDTHMLTELSFTLY